MSNSFQEEQETPEIASIATLAEHMVYRLPGCTDVMIRKTLQTVYADFCRLTGVLTTTRFIKTKSDATHYHIEPMVPHMRIDTICNMWLNDRLLWPHNYISHGDVIVLNPRLCTEDNILRVTAIEVPMFGCEDAPQWFLDKYGQAIVSGALVKLFGMTGKAWTDTAQAQNELVTYENFLTTARLDKMSDGHENGHTEVVDTSDLL